MDRYLNVEDCRNILPKKVLDLWGKLLCEAGIPEADKFYCPFKDCSALMIDDGDHNGRKLARKFKCPHCDRMFCAECKVAWHHGIRCKEFQSRNKDRMEKEDVMLMGLAKKESWQRCPNCNFYIERGSHKLVMALVANKSDLEPNREVEAKEAEKFAHESGVFYIETSVKTGENINDLFYEIDK
ncbi:uncharacterized protein [Arachis hypogaea]|uniref:uncharacterized protein n=1 Tax=Arachis hypogaea TaxID=3818 RepID=UPI003B21481C